MAPPLPELRSVLAALGVAVMRIQALEEENLGLREDNRMLVQTIDDKIQAVRNEAVIIEPTIRPA